MRFWVIDTNVIVSGLLNPRGSSARVVDAILDGRVKLVYDTRILVEYRDVLSRPRLKLTPDKIRAFLDALRGQLMVTPATSLSINLPDPDDVVFVQVALASQERTIVTGNLAHYPPEQIHGVHIITPAQAAAELAFDS